ncbi:hypothetical protein LY41_004121 [Prauserella halophila]|nr:hypothetical protein [Prauserella halophila]
MMSLAVMSLPARSLAATSLIGRHRSDVEVRLDRRERPAIASPGEKRGVNDVSLEGVV